MIKGLFNLIFGLIRLAFLVAALLIVFHPWVIKQAVTFSLSYSLGANVSVQKIKMDWKHTGFEVHGLEIGNPYDFPKGTLADIPLLIISLNLPDLQKGQLHFKAIGIDVRELQVMNAPRQGLNLLALKVFQQKEDTAQTGSKKPSSRFIPEVIIDEFIFSLGDIAYLDMSGASLKQSRYRAQIRGATYYDIRGVHDVVGIITQEALKRVGFAYLEKQFQKFLPAGAMKQTQSKGLLGDWLQSIKDNFSQ